MLFSKLNVLVQKHQILQNFCAFDLDFLYYNISMLTELLDKKRCFKLICGAGNEDLNEVKNLIALYSAAGCKFFDIRADELVFEAAKSGLDFAVPKNAQKDYNFCLSLGTRNDLHMNKVKINPILCKKCSACLKICPQNAINKDFLVDEKKCIGCLKCVQKCPNLAFNVYSKDISVRETFKKFDFAKFKNINCIELHSTGENIDDVLQSWEFLSKNFNGILSFCIGMSKLNERDFSKLLKNIVSMRKPYTTIIQADGASMSGGKNDAET